MRRRLFTMLSLVVCSTAAAQPVPCTECSRGEALIEHFSLQPLRPIAGELTGMQLGTPITAQQYAHVIELRRRVPATRRLGAVDDADVVAIAASLCGAAAGPCIDATAQAMRCLADRCAVDLPVAKAPEADLLELPTGCDRYRKNKRSPPFGVGFDWGNGVHRSGHPADGRVWSFGIESRLRLSNRLGMVARIDRLSGRDEALDLDGDGNDDSYTGSITRITQLAGPSIVLLHSHFESTRRYLRLDVLAGNISTRSQTDESGFGAGADLSYELSIFRVGLRAIQGFGDAREASTLIGHIGFMVGGGPVDNDTNACAAEARSRSRFGLGIGWTLGGYGIPHNLGYVGTGLGLEMVWHLWRSFDALAGADVIVFPGEKVERAIHQAVLGGIRMDHSKRKGRRQTTGFFSTAMAGYSHGATVTPTTMGSGPVADLSVGWGLSSSEGAAHMRLHGRFGISGENIDYRVIFISVGAEIHFDPRSWGGSR